MDVSENSLKEILKEFKGLPVVQVYRSEDLREIFGYRNAKVLGFVKSDIAVSLLRELKSFKLDLEPDESSESSD